MILKFIHRHLYNLILLNIINTFIILIIIIVVNIIIIILFILIIINLIIIIFLFLIILNNFLIIFFIIQNSINIYDLSLLNLLNHLFLYEFNDYFQYFINLFVHLIHQLTGNFHLNI